MDFKSYRTLFFYRAMLCIRGTSLCPSVCVCLCLCLVECTLFMTHCLRLNLPLHTISLVRTCRISSFCTVAWQLARLGLLLTRRIARSLGDSWASCLFETYIYILALEVATGQLREPALCRLYRHTFVPYEVDVLAQRDIAGWRVVSSSGQDLV